MSKKNFNQFNNLKDFYQIVKDGTGHDLARGAFKTNAEQAKIIREEIIPYLTHNYKIQFPLDYTPTTFEKLYYDIASFNEDSNNAVGQHTPMKVVKLNSERRNLLVQKKFFQDFTSLAEDLQDQRKSIDKSLNNLTSNIDVDIKRNWWGSTNIESVEDAISKVYKNLSDYIREYGKALCKINDNQCKTLELISILAKFEDDLYKQLDNSEVATNELRQLIVDWCREQNINDEDVQKLLDYSFQRSITLRDRINNLREELEKKISRLDMKFDSVKNELEQYVEEAHKKLESILSDHKVSIQKTITEQKEALRQTLDDVYSNVHQVVAEIDNKKRNIDNRIEQIVGEIEQLKKELDDERQETTSYYTEQRKEIKQQVDSAISTSKQFLNEQEEKHKAELLYMQSMFKEKLKEQEDAFNKLINKQKEDFEAAQKAIFSLFRKRTILSCLITGLLSVGIAILVCLFL